MSDQTFDLTPDAGIHRKLYVAIGIIWMVLAGVGIYQNLGKEEWSNTTSIGVHLTFGTFQLLFAAFFNKLQKISIKWNDGGIEYHRPWRKEEIQFDRVESIKLHRMKLEMQVSDAKPFTLEFGDFSYAQNAEVKTPLYAFLKEQAEKRNIPLTEV